MENESELARVEVNEVSTEDLEDQSSRWTIEESTTAYVAVDIPDEDDQGETEMDDETENLEPDQRETEREDEPLNKSDEWQSENFNGPDSDHQRGRPYNSSSRSMCRVPEHIREVNEKAFTPRFISIGPLHHKNPSLSVMEDHKLRLLNGLVGKNHCLLETMRKAMKKIEPRARRYYAESFPDLSEDEFVEMMVVDGCFILQLLRLFYKITKGKQLTNDPIFSNRWMLPNIGCDMLMLENQLPMIVLEELHELTSSPEETTSLSKLALHFFSLFHLGRHKITNNEKFPLQVRQKHLLAFFQSIYASRDSRPKSARLRANEERRLNQVYRNLNLHSRGKNWVTNATALKSLGIKFAANPTGNLLDIKLGGSTLRIPTLAIHENNATIMQNMVAYEQCSRDAKPHMTSLIIFLCSIAVVPDDITLLRDATILQHQPGDDQMVIDLLKLLSREIECGINESVLFNQVVSINRYCKSWPVKFRSWYRSCNGPKVLGGLIAVIVIFGIKYLLGV